MAGVIKTGSLNSTRQVCQREIKKQIRVAASLGLSHFVPLSLGKSSTDEPASLLPPPSLPRHFPRMFTPLTDVGSAGLPGWPCRRCPLPSCCAVTDSPRALGVSHLPSRLPGRPALADCPPIRFHPCPPPRDQRGPLGAAPSLTGLCAFSPLPRRHPQHRTRCWCHSAFCGCRRREGDSSPSLDSGTRLGKYAALIPFGLRRTQEKTRDTPLKQRRQPHSKRAAD